MKAFGFLWATYDLTSFSLCELPRLLNTTRKGPGLGLFSSTVWSFLSSPCVLSFSQLNSRRIRQKLSNYLSPLHPAAHIQRLKSPQYLHFVTLILMLLLPVCQDHNPVLPCSAFPHIFNIFIFVLAFS